MSPSHHWGGVWALRWIPLWTPLWKSTTAVQSGWALDVFRYSVVDLLPWSESSPSFTTQFQPSFSWQMTLEIFGSVWGVGGWFITDHHPCVWQVVWAGGADAVGFLQTRCCALCPNIVSSSSTVQKEIVPELLWFLQLTLGKPKLCCHVQPLSNYTVMNFDLQHLLAEACRVGDVALELLHSLVF